MTTVQEEIRDVKAACALLGHHAETIVDQHRNAAVTLQGLARRLRNAGLASPPTTTAMTSPRPSPTPSPAARVGTTGDIESPVRVQEPDVFSKSYAADVYAERRAAVQRRTSTAHRDAASDPKAANWPLLPSSAPSTDSLDPANIYERRRVAGGGSR
jgi:hypothetical protein